MEGSDVDGGWGRSEGGREVKVEVLPAAADHNVARPPQVASGRSKSAAGSIDRIRLSTWGSRCSRWDEGRRLPSNNISTALVWAGEPACPTPCALRFEQSYSILFGAQQSLVSEIGFHTSQSSQIGISRSHCHFRAFHFACPFTAVNLEFIKVNGLLFSVEFPKPELAELVYFCSSFM